MNYGKRKIHLTLGLLAAMAITLAVWVSLQKNEDSGDNIQPSVKLPEFYTPPESRMLEKAFSGQITQILHTAEWAEEDDPIPPRNVSFNYISPGIADAKLESRKHPFLGDTQNNGKTFLEICELRTELPDLETIARQNQFKALVDLLGGKPTMPAWSGELSGDTASDMVSWSLCTPIDEQSIRVMYVSVARTYNVDESKDHAQIDYLFVLSGTAKRNSEAGH